MFRESNLYLSSKGWGRIVLPASASRAGRSWTDHGTARQERGLKHRAAQETRTIPIRPNSSGSFAPTSGGTAPPRTGASSRPAGAGSSRTSLTAPCLPRPASRRSPMRSTAPRWAAAPTTCGPRRVSLGLNSGVPATEIARRAGHDS
jgi:hypothetical protein